MMYKNYCLSAILLCSVIVACNAPKKTATAKKDFAKNSVVAHRGAFKKNNLPENSIAALKEAIRLGCTGSEFDVRMTADDSLIINHDPHYNKLSIEKTTYAELLQFKLYNGEKIPTLREYILGAKENNTGTRLVCEIKPSEISKERGKAIAEKTIRLFKQLGAENIVAYISFDYDILKKIAALNPQAHTQYLNGEKSPEQLKADGISGADYHYTVFKAHPDWVSVAKKLGIALNVWTVNDANEMDWLIANEFEFITTNEPELLFERINKSPIASGWKLNWSDEFNQDGLPDSTKWNYDAGTGCPDICGWGNNELQYYTKADTSNAIVKNGKLLIKAVKQTKENNAYTSARLVTKHKGDWLYGRIEVKAKLPAGRGIWPAIWMLSTDWEYGGWPSSGEIDIMENVGYNPDTVFSSTHTKKFHHSIGTQKTKGLKVNDVHGQFHLYAIEWYKDRIDFFIDDNLFFSFANTGKGFEEWPFDKKFHLLLNVAVGGNWGGQRGVDETIFPATMQVDYVRVYQQR
jgi:beta-glucanase (GH16 family)/glycerophosphoryl diester phosphodiesterase